MEITADFIKRAIAGKHYNYYQNVALAEKIRIHADGIIPEALIFNRRPSEPEEIKTYRASIYVPKTKNPISKVINSLEKIRRSEDWEIDYEKESIPKTIAEKETLEAYCEQNYPIHTSLTNWAFSELMKQYLLDANGIVAIIPENTELKPNEYIKPIATFFGSSQVIDFQPNEYAVLLSNDTSTYRTPSGKIERTNGLIYYIITTTQVVRYEQISSGRDLAVTQVYDHNIGKLPAFKVGGMYLKRINNETIYESRIASMVPSLDEAAREYSDLQAEIVQHIHSEKYAYTNTECPDCNGTGKHLVNGVKTECTRCGGTGSILNTSPYGMTLIKATTVGENALPTPPIGYVQKSSEIAVLQDTRVRQHLYDALSTLNMEFLAETPLNQSGTAKMVDKDELNNFVNSIAEDIVKILDNVYYFINEYRYMFIVPNYELRAKMLPNVNVPTKYDMLSSSVLLQDLTAARNAKVSTSIIKELEIEYAKKKFNTEHEIGNQSEAIFELDPLYGLNEDEKMTRLSNNGITEIDYIISCNINQFVKKANERFENTTNEDGFFKQQFEVKYAEMVKLATEVQNANKSKAVVIDTTNGGL